MSPRTKPQQSQHRSRPPDPEPRRPQAPGRSAALRPDRAPAAPLRGRAGRGGGAGPASRRYLQRVRLAQVHVEGRAVGQHLPAAGHGAQDVGPHLGQLCHRGPHQLPGGRHVPHGRGGPPQAPATPPGRRRHVAVSCSAPAPLPGPAANRRRRC